MALPEETIRKVFGANAAGDEEAAAIAQLHSIAAGLLNTGYYARFFKEETTGKKWNISLDWANWKLETWSQPCVHPERFKIKWYEMHLIMIWNAYFIDQYVVSYQILGYFNKISVRPLKERKLGSGSFGSVYLCTHMMDEIELGVFAVKKLALGDDARRLRQVVREVKALELLGPGFRVHVNVLFFCCFSMFFLCFFWGVGVGVWMNDRLTRCTEMILEYLWCTEMILFGLGFLDERWTGFEELDGWRLLL